MLMGSLLTDKSCRFRYTNAAELGQNVKDSEIQMLTDQWSASLFLIAGARSTGIGGFFLKSLLSLSLSLSLSLCYYLSVSFFLSYFFLSLSSSLSLFSLSLSLSLSLPFFSSFFFSFLLPNLLLPFHAFRMLISRFAA